MVVMREKKSRAPDVEFPTGKQLIIYAHQKGILLVTDMYVCGVIVHKLILTRLGFHPAWPAWHRMNEVVGAIESRGSVL